MPPLKPMKRAGAGKSVHVMEAANRVSHLLQSRTQLPSGFEAELESLVKRSFSISLSSASHDTLLTLDAHGCDIWNATSNILRRQGEEYDSRIHAGVNKRVATLLRVFAFSLLDSTYNASSKSAKSKEQHIRTFGNGLKACRYCLDAGALDLSLMVLERCAEHVKSTEEDLPLVEITEDDGETHNSTALQALVQEFYLLRVTHAWKSDRLDVAEHFYIKISAAQLSIFSDLSVRAASLLYEIGKGLAKGQLFDTALKWLERALNAQNAGDVERSSHDADELRIAIATCLGLLDCLISLGTPDSLTRSQDLVKKLNLEYGLGNRMAVQLMRLKILLARLPVNEEALADAILKVLRSAVLTEHTFKIMMQSVHRVRKIHPEIACHALSELITSRLLPDLTATQKTESGLHSWVEKSCVTYTLFATSNIEGNRNFAIDGLEHVLNAIMQRFSNSLSPKATHAAQALIWKAAGDAGADTAQRWCSLLQHPLFNGAGNVNKAKIGRKAMLMAITKEDFNTARETFFQMPAAAQNDDITRYLTFKLALRMNDYILAKESLNVIADRAEGDPEFLYACVLEAQQSQMRHITVASLQAILDEQPASINLPTLLRCTARLLFAELETPDRNLDEVMEEILQVFEHAATNRQVLQKSGERQWHFEIQWWTKNAYNLALRLCGQIHPEHLLRLLQVCTTFIEWYPDDASLGYHGDVKRRQGLCHFLSASALVVLGRSSDEGSEHSLQYYLQARQEIDAFKALQQYFKEPGEEEATRSRLFEVLKFDLECIYQLKHWEELEAALQACLNFQHVDRWDALADIILIIHRQTGSVGLTTATNAGIMELLERIINQTWLGDKDIVKAARWLRLSFSVDLNDGSGEFALKLMVEAANMAKKGSEGRNGRFPGTELQWLSRTAFNKAVDLLSAGNNGESTTWIDAALELARYADDEGALHANLTYKKQQATARMIANA